MMSVGSVCSGIEAASVAWQDMGFEFKWFSENSYFPSRVLNTKYPNIPNMGDMKEVSYKISSEAIEYPDLICGGTPCQAFSLAGFKRGLEDSRGNLTTEFVKIINTNDMVRASKKLPPSIVLWENVEGVLTDKTNAFGSFISSLAGIDTAINIKKYPRSGLIRGPKRNIAWRVLDAKYFGLPQQRRRLFVVAGGKDFNPERVIFDGLPHKSIDFGLEDTALSFKKNEYYFEIFRNYTDCLCSSYGTKWNGNAAANNGSLFVVQNSRLRRLTPLECERLMGFPDNYTKIQGASDTERYRSLGNSWAVPVVRWIGERILQNKSATGNYDIIVTANNVPCEFFDISQNKSINGTAIPQYPQMIGLNQIIDTGCEEKFYISPAASNGILRRANGGKKKINYRLEEILKGLYKGK